MQGKRTRDGLLGRIVRKRGKGESFLLLFPPPHGFRLPTTRWLAPGSFGFYNIVLCILSEVALPPPPLESNRVLRKKCVTQILLQRSVSLAVVLDYLLCQTDFFGNALVAPPMHGEYFAHDALPASAS